MVGWPDQDRAKQGQPRLQGEVQSPGAMATLPGDGQQDTPPEDTKRISFWDADELGTVPSKRCPNNQGCPS